MALQMKVNKGLGNEGKETRESVEPSTPTGNNSNINAPKYGTVIPNRIFVGGISSSTTEDDLVQLFSNYGTVVNSKIIVDRAGVSKGYGFVTFENDEDARRLQKDAENIVLKERRLNIASAIRKQGYSRQPYEGAQSGPGSPVPLPNQFYRQNGVTYTFHNGMAYFPHQPLPAAQAAQPMTPLPTNHMEHSPPVYSATGAYPGISQTSSGQTFPFSYAPQGHIYYATHYPYHVPQYEGCYQLGEGAHNGMLVQSSSDSVGMIFPQYYLTHQPSQPELAYFQPQGSVQPLNISQESMQPVIYTPPRGYDSTTLFYSEQKVVANDHPTPPSPHPLPPPPPPPPPQLQPPRPSHHHQQQSSGPHTIRGEVRHEVKTTETPTITSSVNKTYKDKKEDQNLRQHHTTKPKNNYLGKKGPPPPRHLNNNNPDVTNRNNVGKKGRQPSPPTHSPPTPRAFVIRNSNQSSSPVQVPQFPFFSGPRQYYNAPSAVTPFCTAPSRRAYFHRNKHNGRGGKSNTKWFKNDNSENGMDEGSCTMANPLTPPITPRSPQDIDISQTDDIVQSMQTLTI